MPKRPNNSLIFCFIYFLKKIEIKGKFEVIYIYKKKKKKSGV
jgi:hypothetical protein